MKKPRILSTFSGLDRSIYILFLSQVISSLGHFVQPFLTLFLTDKLEYSATKAGIFVFLSAVSWVPGSLIGGKLADHVGRKKIMVIFYTAASLCLVPCAFLGISPLIPWLLILSSFFYGVTDPVNDSMIADITPPDQRKQAFSLLYLGHNLGFAVGPMVAGFLFNHHLAWLFLGDALTSLIGVTLILLFIRESKPTEEEIQRSFKEDTTPEKAEKGSLLSVLLKRPILVCFMFVHMIFSFVYSHATFTLPLQLGALFKDAGPSWYGLLMMFNAITVLVTTTLILHWTRKVKPIYSAALSGVFYAIGFGMIFWLKSIPLFFVATLVFTLGEILGATNSSAYVSNHSPITHRGRINSVAPIIMWAGQAFGPILSGKIIESHSIAVLWPLSALLAGAGAVLLFVLGRIEKNPAAQEAPGK